MGQVAEDALSRFAFVRARRGPDLNVEAPGGDATAPGLECIRV
jgi:hypothetical protein